MNLKFLQPFIALFLFPIYSLLAQTNYEPGYIIKNDGERQEGWVKNYENRSTDQVFYFKNSENSQEQELGVDSIKECGIDNVAKFVKWIVEIDLSSNDVSDLSTSRNPEFNTETLFLKELIDGEATLYQYKRGALTKYFYAFEQAIPQQLIFKRYTSSNNKVSTNSYYKQQLRTKLYCDKISQKAYNNLEYNEEDLTDFFVKYNNCKGSSSTLVRKTKKRGDFNLNIRPGINFSSLEYGFGTSISRNKSFENASSIRLGLELEYIFPFNNKKWSMFAEPTYRTYKADADNDTSAEYNSIEIPLGIRHYLFLNSDSKIFVNGAVQLDLPIDEVVYRYEAGSSVNFAFGAGFKYMDRYSIEARYSTTRSLTTDYVSIISEFTNFAVILGYTLF